MRHISMPILLAISATFVRASGETPSVDPVESALERRVEQIPKLNLPKLLAYNLEKLEAVYQKALRNAEDEDHRKAIAASQEAWLRFYDADGAVASWNAKGGSFAYPAQVQQKVYQIKLRMYQLSTPFLQGWNQVPTIPNPSTEAGADQPSKRSESKPEGDQKPQPDSNRRSR